MEDERCCKCGTEEDLWDFDPDGLFCGDCRGKFIAERIASFKGETLRQESMVCPHCGHVFTDSRRYDGCHGMQLTCGDCGNDFMLELCLYVKERSQHMKVSTLYSTRKIEVERANYWN